MTNIENKELKAKVRHLFDIIREVNMASDCGEVRSELKRMRTNIDTLKTTL